MMNLKKPGVIFPIAAYFSNSAKNVRGLLQPSPFGELGLKFWVSFGNAYAALQNTLKIFISYTRVKIYLLNME